MSRVTRREALRQAGQAAAVTVVAGSFLDLAFGADGVVTAQAAPQATLQAGPIMGRPRRRSNADPAGMQGRAAGKKNR